MRTPSLELLAISDRWILRHNADIVHARGQRHSRAGCLGQPPHLPKPAMLAHHHVLAEIIHKGRANLRSRIQRARMREGPQQRVRFRSVIARDCAARGPGIEGRYAVPGECQRVPQFPPQVGFVRSKERGFDRRRGSSSRARKDRLSERQDKACSRR